MTPHICFVGLQNLPLLAPEFAERFVGGAELQQTLLARALARRGFPVSMVVADLGQADGRSWDGVVTRRTYRPQQGIRFLRFIHPRWTSVWAALRRADADVYYTSCCGHLVGQLAMFTRRYGRKLVYRIASNADCDPAGLLVGSQHEKWLYRYGLKRADLVLAQTEEQACALRTNFGRDSRVIRPLVEVRGRRRDFGERDIDVLWVGNLRPLKRPELLLEVARGFPALRFHMVGGPVETEPAYFERIAQAAATLPNVTFHGFVPYHKTGELYERAKVLAGTSETEGFPNTYLQAWVRGTPVVAYIDPGNLIARNDLGRVVDSPEDLQRAIAGLTSGRETWMAASTRCARYIDQHYDEERMVAPYAEALAELAASPQAAISPQIG